MRAAVLIAMAVACSDSKSAPAPTGDAGAIPSAKPTRDLPRMPSPIEAAKAAVGKACDRGDTKACIGADRPDAACLHGSADGCILMATREPTRAAIYRGRACRRGSSIACESLGEQRKTPRVTGRGLGVYEHAVGDCWAETRGVDRGRDIRGTLAVTTDHRGKTTAIARISNADVGRCIERSASGWVFEGNKDIDLLIRPAARVDPFASIGVLGGSGGGVGGVIGGVQGGSLGGFGLTAPKSVVNVVVVQLSGNPSGRVDVTRKLRTRYAAMLKGCHRRELFSDPDLRAVVSVRFTLTPSGRIDDIAASSQAPDRMRQCIKRRARIWRFEPSRSSNGKPESARFVARINFRTQ